MEESKNAAEGLIFPPKNQQGNAAHESPDVNNFPPEDPCFMISSVEYGCRVFYDMGDNSQDSRSNMSSSVDYGCHDYYPSFEQQHGDDIREKGEMEESKNAAEVVAKLFAVKQPKSDILESWIRRNTAHESPDFNNSAPADPCNISSGVDYGCRDYYVIEDRKDGNDYADPENSRGEWWQDSFYY